MAPLFVQKTAAKLLAICLLIIPVLYACNAPLNQDEFMAYRILRCPEPLNWPQPLIRESCGEYDLKLFEKWLPLRTYQYIGFVSSALYFPVFKIWPSYLSARLTSLITLVVLSALLTRLLKVPLIFGLVPVFLNLPLVAQSVVDTGPVAFHLVLCLLIPWIYLKSDQRWSAVLIGVLIFLGLANKPVFLGLIPGIFLLSLAARPIYPRHEVIKKVWATWALAGITCLALSAIYFSAETRYGKTYLQEFLGHTQVRQEIPLSKAFSKVVPFISNFENFLHRVYPINPGFSTVPPSLGTDFITVSLWVFGLLIALFYFRLRRSDLTSKSFGQCLREDSGLRLAIAGLAAFTITELFLIQTPASWAGHHFVLPVPFLLVSLTYLIHDLWCQQQKKLLFAGLALGLASMVTPLMHFREIGTRLQVERYLGIHHFLRDQQTSKQMITVSLDWGYHYFETAFGPEDQMSLRIKYFGQRPEAEAFLKDLSATTNRKLVFVGLDPPDSAVVRGLAAFPALRKLTPGTSPNVGRRNWTLWVQD